MRFAIFSNLLILAVLMSSSCMGLGISYHRSVNFEPGLTESYPLCVRNSHDYYFPITLSVSGELAEYVKIKETKMTLGPHEARCTEYSVKLPQSLNNYGQQSARIIASQVIDPYEQGMFGVQENIVHKFSVFVPYPGKYVTMEIKGENVNQDETVQFVVKATNYGSEKVEKAKALIDIFGADNQSNYVTTIETREKPIGSMESVTLYTILDTVGLKPGVYGAKGMLDYGPDIARAETSFNIGSFDVIVYNYTRNLKKGKINRFDITLQSKWNNRIDALRAEVELSGIPERMVTPTMSLPAWDTIVLTGYVDVPASLESKEYDGTIYIIYGNTTTKNIVVDILGETEIKDPVKELPEPVESQRDIFSVKNLLIMLIILFVIVDVVLIWRKRQKR